MDIYNFCQHLNENEIKNQVTVKLRSNGNILQIGEEYYKSNIRFEHGRLIDYLDFLMGIESANILSYDKISSDEIKVHLKNKIKSIEKIESSDDMIFAIIQHK